MDAAAHAAVSNLLHDVLADDLPAALTEVAAQLRAVLAELDEPGNGSVVSTVSRRRIEGAVLALDVLARGDD